MSRVVAAAGGLLVLLSLLWTWNYVGDQPVSAWENYARTDWLVALAALAAAAGAALPLRLAGRLLSLAAAAAVVAFLVRVMLAGDFVRGPALALLGSVLVVAGVVLESLPAGARGRLAAVAAPAAGVAQRARRRGIPLPASADRGEWRAFAAWVWPIVTWTPLVAALVWLWATAVPPLAPGGGTDGSWVTALHLAHIAGLDFGTEVVWTYGPLGYLTVPRVVDREQAMLGYAYVMASYWALAATTVALVRRSVGVVLAFVAALVVCETFRATGPDEQTQFAVAATACGWALMALRAKELPASSRWPVLQALLGAFAAVTVLVKLNTGATVVLVLGVTALATTRDWRRPYGVAAFAGGFAVTLVAVWLVLGQSLGALDDYFRMSYEVVAGFADYMQDGDERWLYAAAAAISAGLAVLAWRETRSWPALRRAGGLLVVALVMFNAFKQGYVRHDGLSFFATGLFVALALGSREAGHRWAPWLVASVCVAAFLLQTELPLSEFHRPAGTRQALRESVETLRRPEGLVAASRAETIEREAIPPRALQLVGDRPVHVFPQEAGAAWAHSLSWRPLPVFQSYQAYTPALTQRNADVLRSGRAPERILRQVEGVGFADPESVVEVMCRYVQVFADRRWQVLARVPDRCGAPRPAARVEARTEQPVPVPRVGPDELLLMRVEGLGKGLGESLLGLLWKPYARSVTLDDRSSDKIAPSLATVPALLAAGRRADYPGEYRLAVNPSTLTFHVSTHGVVGAARALDRAIAVVFLRVDVRRPALGAAASP